jgi:hypothetical protein
LALSLIHLFKSLHVAHFFGKNGEEKVLFFVLIRTFVTFSLSGQDAAPGQKENHTSISLQRGESER